MFRIMVAWVVLVLMACAPSSQLVNDPEKTNEVLISFMTKAQADYWLEAMDNITYEERVAMMDGDQIKPEYQTAIKRVRLSAISKMDFSLDRKGRLIGVKAMLDEFNKRYTVSDQQRGVNLSEVEKARADRINKLREEGQRILDEQKNTPQDTKEEVMTNRLTEEERQKYGSTAPANPVPASEPESTEDEGSWQEGSSAPASTSDSSGGGWR